MRRCFVALAVTALTGGCSIVTDLSALAPNDGDAAWSGDESGVGTDASVDSSPPSDSGDGGSGDVADVGDAQPRKYCEQLSFDWGYNYCRDFDDSEPILFEWDVTKVDTGASITRDSKTAFSAPGAFLARLDAGAGACTNAYVEKKVAKPIPGKVSVNFRVRLGSADSPDADYTGNYMTVRVGTATSPCDLVFSGDATSGAITEKSGGTDKQHPFALRWPAQRAWTLVALTVDRAARTLQVNIDGKPVYSTTRPLADACGTSSDVILAPGIACHAATTAPAEVRIDNLVVNY